MSFFVVLSVVFLPIHYFSILPDTIPIHFNARGEADRFGSKFIIWLLPMFSIALHFLFKWLFKRPHQFNYMVEITEDNAEKQYTLAIKAMRIIHLAIQCLFLYIVYSICVMAIKAQQDFSPTYVFFFLGIILLGVLTYIYISKKKPHAK